MLFAVTTHAAVMPDYQVLSSIDNNVSAPTDVALDRLQNVYVAESSQNRVQIFTPSGVYARTLSGLNRPICVNVDDSDRIFVCNKDNGSVAVYDSGLNFLFKLGWQDGVVDGEFVQPTDVAISSTGSVYVVDKGGNVVKIYNSDGSYAGDFAPLGPGSVPVSLDNPTSIAIEKSSQNIIVLDHPLSGNLIYVFDMNGGFLKAYNKSGTMVGDLHISQHLTVDSEDRIYVTDSFQNITLVYDKNNGAYLGEVFDANDRVRIPLGLTIGESGKLYVASLNTGKVKVFQIMSSTFEPGDCNGDGIVSAGDISALALEFFDGDGNVPADVAGGTFPGNPAGCDANEDGIVSAGDVSCTALLFFNGPGACSAN
jgi:sugar lactone lactonase YvrE